MNQTIEATIRLASSPRDILAEDAETGIIASLIKGISIDVRLNVWKKIADVLSKVQENEELQAILPTLLGISPALLLKIKGDLEIEVDESMQEKLF